MQFNHYILILSLLTTSASIFCSAPVGKQVQLYQAHKSGKIVVAQSSHKPSLDTLPLN